MKAIRTKDVHSGLEIQRGQKIDVKERFISNLKQLLRHLQRGMTPSLQALLKQLEKPDSPWVYNLRRENGSNLSHLFLAHKQGSADALRFHHVFMIDATYKTNKYRLPVVEIIGVTATGRSFPAAYALIQNEGQVNYEWLLTKFKALLPLSSENTSVPGVVATGRELSLMGALGIIMPHTKHVL